MAASPRAANRTGPPVRWGLPVFTSEQDGRPHSNFVNLRKGTAMSDQQTEMKVAHDDKPAEHDLKLTIEERRAHADAEAKTRLASRGLAAGCMVRCDDEPKGGDKPVIDEGTARRLLKAVA